MRSPISGKIPKKSGSAFSNRGYFTLTCLMEAIFVLTKSSTDAAPRAG
jgi:hypothetical protein